jgi:alpha 1,2-mannosyltransferase
MARRGFHRFVLILCIIFTFYLISFYNRGTSQYEDEDITEAYRYTDNAKKFTGEFRSKENATFVTLARNSDLHDIAYSIRSVEDRYNSKFHHDWVFLNNDPFSEEFINVTTRLVSGNAKYGLIDPSHWSYPAWIDQTKAREAREEMGRQGIIYGESESYRHMCRYESGFFFQHPLMQDYKYYWRVEPSITIHCDIDYDVFEFMRLKEMIYGFTITIHEYLATIETLWDETLAFIQRNPNYINTDSLLEFISDDNGESYNLCHFWSNFEIADADFWRGEMYQDYFNHLDAAGGYFYERWGDAPVHSLAASLFLNSSQVHFFEDIGYSHSPYTHCPTNALERGLSCTCLAGETFDWDGYSCTKKYYKAAGLKLPFGVNN